MFCDEEQKLHLSFTRCTVRHLFMYSTTIVKNEY